MAFNPSKYPIKDIIYVTKDSIENKFFKLNIDYIEYPVLISNVRESLIELTIFTRRRQFNEDNPIEKKVREFSLTNFDTFIELFDDEIIYSKDDLFYPSLNHIFDDNNFVLFELNERTNDFLNSLIRIDDLITLYKCQITYIDLKQPRSLFERKFKNFILEKSIKEINENNNLQDKLEKIKENRKKERKEREEHMKNVRKKEQKIQNFNDNLKNYKSKNASDYNIH